MKSPQQQLKLFFPLYERASLLLFLFFISSKTKAQILFDVKDTSITIGENTILYTADAGEIHQADLKNSGDQSPKKKNVSKYGKRRKSVFNTNRTAAKHHAEKVRAYPKAESAELAASHPDDFFSSHQKGEAVYASVVIYDHLNFSIESKKLRFSPGYLNLTQNKIVSNSFIFFKDFYWFRYKTRPPPSSRV